MKWDYAMIKYNTVEKVIRHIHAHTHIQRGRD